MGYNNDLSSLVWNGKSSLMTFTFYVSSLLVCPSSWCLCLRYFFSFFLQSLFVCFNFLVWESIVFVESSSYSCDVSYCGVFFRTGRNPHPFGDDCSPNNIFLLSSVGVNGLFVPMKIEPGGVGSVSSMWRNCKLYLSLLFSISCPAPSRLLTRTIGHGRPGNLQHHGFLLTPSDLTNWLKRVT
jgi:hypothetical protein